jgi:hypothetical protein
VISSGGSRFEICRSSMLLCRTVLVGSVALNSSSVAMSRRPELAEQGSAIDHPPAANLAGTFNLAAAQYVERLSGASPD